MAKRQALLRAMRDANLTSRDAATALGIGEARMSQLINGAFMREDQIATLCEMLGICADVIILDRPPTGSDEYESEYIQLYREKLNPAQRVRLIQFLRELPGADPGKR